MVAQMELVDRQLLNIIQSSFPLVSKPFKAIGSQLDVPEEEVIRRVAALKKKNVVRQISAIFDTRRLGYKTCLVAARFPHGSLTRAAHHINEHPGVSHNYARNGYFNLWFTIAVPPGEVLEETVDRLAKETHAEAVRIMPTIRFFKIGVNFDMVEEQGAAHEYYSPDGYKDGQANWNKVEPVTDFEVQVIRELQEDIALTPRPFEGMAKRLGISEEELFSYGKAFQERGIMRRFSAVLHHRRAGFRANGMAVWKVQPERSEEVGRIMAANPAVTHCYERPTFPDWQYTHFSMIHATSKEGCEEIAREISQQTGIADYQVLYSYREYKKTRVRYFV
ncbi:MAG: Lrp/AsnC family transcriptional regulator [Dehalococcoidia bacterium]|nr:Lrp/AsnC family transcriptional regulator [Dehalococcoidia bacterium]